MHILHLLIPDALVATDFAPDLLRGLKLPNLDLLCAHGSDDGAPPVHDDLAPWQSWLLQDDRAANIAEVFAAALDTPIPVGNGVWLAEPVHFEIGLDHLVLADPRRLHLTQTESEALAEVARPLLYEDGWLLDNVRPQYWLLQRDTTSDLVGAAIECAIGAPVGPLLPTDQGSGAALHWRRTANEIQMTWHTHHVNLERAATDRQTVNGLWLSGNGRTGTDMAQLRSYCHIKSTLPLLTMLADQVLASGSAPALRTWDGLIDVARHEDWSGWRNSVQALDVQLEGVVADMRRGHVAELVLVLCGRRNLRVLRIRSGDLWKFWRRGKAVELFADEPR